MAKLKKTLTLAAVLCLFTGSGYPAQAQEAPPRYKQAQAVNEVLRSHGYDMDRYPESKTEPGKQWYDSISTGINSSDPQYFGKKITLKNIDAHVYASADQLADQLALFRRNDGWEPVAVGCGEAWVEKKCITPGMYSAYLIAGNVTIRATFNSQIFDDKPYTQEKEEWYKEAATANPAALRSLIAAIAADICRLNLDSPSGSAAAAKPPADRPSTPPPSNPPPSKDPCASDRDALMAASLGARMAWANLQTVRSAVTELDAAWENNREAAYWSGALDVALMAGSVLTKPLAKVLGAEILKQPLKTAVMEAALKGMMTESLKQFNAYCHGRDLQPAEVLAAVANKAPSSAANKVLNEFATNVLEKMLMDKIAAGDMGGLETLQIASGTVDGTMRGGTTPAMTKFVRENYAAPAAQFMGLMLSLKSAIDGAWTAHGKLENLRLAIKELRDREIEEARKWDAAMAEMDRTRSSYNYCRTLHPDSPKDDATEAAAGFQPPPSTSSPAEGRRKSAEAGPTPPAAGEKPPDGGPTLVLPYKTASLSLRNGEAFLNIAPGDYYYSKQGLVSGSRLVSINFKPYSVRTLDDLKKLIYAPGEEMTGLEFVTPDGKKVLLPVPLDQ